jgi:hypothetical protein
MSGWLAGMWSTSDESDGIQLLLLYVNSAQAEDSLVV